MRSWYIVPNIPFSLQKIGIIGWWIDRKIFINNIFSIIIGSIPFPRPSETKKILSICKWFIEAILFLFSHMFGFWWIKIILIEHRKCSLWKWKWYFYYIFFIDKRHKFLKGRSHNGRGCAKIISSEGSKLFNLKNSMTIQSSLITMNIGLSLYELSIYMSWEWTFFVIQLGKKVNQITQSFFRIGCDILVNPYYSLFFEQISF